MLQSYHILGMLPIVGYYCVFDKSMCSKLWVGYLSNCRASNNSLNLAFDHAIHKMDSASNVPARRYMH